MNKNNWKKKCQNVWNFKDTVECLSCFIAGGEANFVITGDGIGIKPSFTTCSFKAWYILPSKVYAEINIASIIKNLKYVYSEALLL